MVYEEDYEHLKDALKYNNQIFQPWESKFTMADVVHYYLLKMDAFDYYYQEHYDESLKRNVVTKKKK